MFLAAFPDVIVTLPPAAAPDVSVEATASDDLMVYDRPTWEAPVVAVGATTASVTKDAATSERVTLDP